MKIFKVAALGCAMAAATATASAAPVLHTPVTSNHFTENREEGLMELQGTGRFEGMVIDWVISYAMATEIYTYSYGFAFDTDETNQLSISHLILNLSDNCGDDLDSCFFNASVNGGATSYVTEWDDAWGESSGNPGFPAASTFAGVKLDFGNVDTALWTLTFNSYRAPMWGDIYLKAGPTDSLFNTGLLAGNRASSDINLFIATPDTVNGPPPPPRDVPEPATLALLGFGLLGAGVARRRKQ